MPQEAHTSAAPEEVRDVLAPYPAGVTRFFCLVRRKSDQVDALPLARFTDGRFTALGDRWRVSCFPPDGRVRLDFVPPDRCRHGAFVILAFDPEKELRRPYMGLGPRHLNYKRMRLEERVAPADELDLFLVTAPAGSEAERPGPDGWPASMLTGVVCQLGRMMRILWGGTLLGEVCFCGIKRTTGKLCLCGGRHLPPAVPDGPLRVEVFTKDGRRAFALEACSKGSGESSAPAPAAPVVSPTACVPAFLGVELLGRLGRLRFDALASLRAVECAGGPAARLSGAAILPDVEDLLRRLRAAVAALNRRADEEDAKTRPPQPPRPPASTAVGTPPRTTAPRRPCRLLRHFRRLRPP